MSLASPFPLRPVVCGLGNLVAFGLAAVLTCTLLGLRAPLPELPTITEKWAHFRQHGHEYDAIFIGSSRVYQQVIPARFDAATAAAGRATKSFNFGQDGAFPPESFYVLRKILTLPLPHLRWVFIELMGIKVRSQGQNEEAAQSLYWHDWHHTQLSAREVLASHFAPALSCRLLWREYRMWLQTACNLGAGTRLLEPLWQREKPENTPPWLNAAGHHNGRHRGLQGRDRGEYLQLRAQLAEAPPSRLQPYLQAELSSLVAAVRQAGAEPIFVISPTINPADNFLAAPGGATLLRFNDPQLYPELYLPEHYYNVAHLNSTGAALYTDRLAKRFLEATAPRP